jgi:hypothetical protein
MVPKKTNDDQLNNAEKKLHNLTGDIELEEVMAQNQLSGKMAEKIDDNDMKWMKWNYSSLKSARGWKQLSAM